MNSILSNYRSIQASILCLTCNIAASLPLVARAEVSEAEEASARNTFGRIYHDNSWGSPESRSGPGSGLDQTVEVRRQLPDLLARFDVHSLLDAACGDFWWMKELDLPTVAYTGMDIVPELIQHNERTYGRSYPSRHFGYGHISKSPLSAYDLVLVRDVLLHQPLQTIAATIRNIKSSGSKWLLATTYAYAEQNVEILEGDWRPVNLQLPPFNFPEPVEVINERSEAESRHIDDKFLGLWRLDDIAL